MLQSLASLTVGTLLVQIVFGLSLVVIAIGMYDDYRRNRTWQKAKRNSSKAA